MKYLKIAALCLSFFAVTGVQGEANAAVVKKQSMDKCKAVSSVGLKSVTVELAKQKKSLSYFVELTAPGGKHHLAITSCSKSGTPSKVGAPAQGHRFTLYDLGGGKLMDGDEVLIKGPHGLLLGLNVQKKPPQLVANRSKITPEEKFIIQRADGKKAEIKAADKITLHHKGRNFKKFLIAKGGQAITTSESKTTASKNPFTIGKLVNIRLSKKAPPVPPVKAVTAKELGKCNSAIKIVTVKGTPYKFELTAPSGKHHLAITSCRDKKVKVGAAPTGHGFTLYDINGGDLKHNDKVFIKGPHGLLLGLSKGGDLIGSRSAMTSNEQFTVGKTTKKNQPFVMGDAITLTASNGNFLVAPGKGGQKIIGDKKPTGGVEKFKVRKLSRMNGPSLALNKQDPSKCTQYKKIKFTSAISYELSLSTVSGNHSLSLATCAWVGMTKGDGQTFFLYDLNKGDLEYGDTVAIKAPHGYLLGLEKGMLVADRTSLKNAQKFTIKRTDKKKGKGYKIVLPGDKVAFLAEGKAYFTSLPKGGGRLNVFKKTKIEASEIFKVKSLVRVTEVVKGFAENCKGKSGKDLAALKKKNKKAVKVPGFGHEIRLQQFNKKVSWAGTTCMEVGLSDRSSLFIMYDLNGGDLVHDDQVVIRGPNKLLLGFDKKGVFKAERSKYATREVFRVRKVDAYGRPLAGKIGKFIKNEDFIALLTFNDRYLVSDGKTLKASKNLVALKGKIAPPKENERFVVGNLIKERDKQSYKKLAKKAAVKLALTAATATVELLANGVISTVMGQAIGDKLVPLNKENKSGNKTSKKKSNISFGPQACLKNSSLVAIPLEDDEKQDNATAQRNNEKGKKAPLTGVKKLMRKLMAKLDKAQSCANINFSLPVPGTDLILKAFTSRDVSRELPLWHIALIAGPKTLNNNPLANIPALKAITGGLKIDRLLAIVSEDQAKVSFKTLGRDIKKILMDYQQTAAVSDKYGNERKTGTLRTDKDGVVLQQGVNLFGSFKLTSGGGLGALSELILPGSTKSKEPWRFAGTLGMTFIQKLMNKVSNFEKIEAAEYTNKTALKLEIWLPSHTPFPYNLTNNKKIFHAEVEKARFVFDLSKNKDKGGKVSAGLKLTTQVWNNYYILGSSAFPIKSTGEFTFQKGAITGRLEGAYQVAANKDPLGKLIPGVHLTKLMIGGGYGVKDTGGSNTKTLTFSTGAQITAGKEAVESTFDLIIEKEGSSKVKLKELRISLSGSGEDSKIQIKNLGAIGKIPLANELVLEKGVIGITPKKSGLPDFYITGGVTWSRTNMGGKIAIMKTTPKGKSKEDLFVFVTSNDFSLANMLPDTNAMKVPRSLLTLLKMPQTMLMFNTVKGDDVELAVTDFPAPLQPMFEGFTSGAEGLVPIKGDSLSLITALDFSAKERSVMTDGFAKIGLSKFGPTGPLLAVGSIGGLKSGELTIGLAAKLPGYAFPDKVFGQTNPIAQIVKPQGVAFFVNVVVKGAPRVEVGLEGKLRLELPRLDDFSKKDRQDLTGKVFIKAAATGDIGIFIAGDKAGTWQDPMGLNKNIGIKNPAFLAGIIVSANAAANINIGIGGTLVFKIKDKDGNPQTLEYDGDIFIGGGVSAVPTYVVPNKFGLNLGASKISIDTIIRVADAVIDGMLQGGLINVIIDGDPNNPLAPGLPNGAVKTGINTLRNGLAKISLPELLQIDKIPLPGLVLTPATGNDKVRIYFATPGVYIPGREETMNGLGFSVTGAASIDLLGKNHPIGEIDVTLSAANGLRLYGQIAPIHLGALKLGSKPSTANPAGGTALDVKASADETYFMLDGQVELLPLIDDETRIKLSTTETSFHIKKSIGGNLFNIELDVNSSSELGKQKFMVDAKIDNGINKVVRSVFTTLAMPDAAIDAIMSKNPLVIESFRMKGDLVGFAKGTGDDIVVQLQPIYFGERRPLIDAHIPPVDWKNPANILLGGQELPNALLGSLIDYMIDHPEKAIKLPDINLGVMALKGAFFGGAERPQSYKSFIAEMKVKKEPKPSESKWQQEKPKEGVFLLKGKTELLGSKSDIRVEITPRDIAFSSSANLLNGALKTKITGQGTIKDNIITDLKFRGEVTSGIDAFVKNTLLPGLGIPGPVLNVLKKATPVFIRKVAFDGELAGIITGNSPVRVHLDPVFFGDTDWAIKHKTVTVTLPKLDTKNPVKSLLAGPAVIAALSKAMVEYLIENPKKLPALDLVIMKLDASTLGGVEVTGFSEEGKKEKVFQIKGGLELPLSRPKADIRIGANYIEMNFSDELLGGVIKSNYTMSGDIKTGSLNMHGSVTADFGNWLKVDGLGAVVKEFDKLNPGFAKAKKDLASAMVEVKKLDKDIAEKRAVVKADRDKAASPLIAAEAEVAKLQKQVIFLSGQLAGHEKSISRCNQSKRICVLRKPYRSGWKIKWKCAKRATVPNLPARAVCEARNTPRRVRVVSVAARLAGVVSAKAVAGKTLEAIRKGITDFPIDLDPRVSVLIAARVAATVALKTAQLAVEGADIANRLIPLGLNAITSDGAFVFEKGDFYGRFPQVTKGEAMVFDLKYKMMGKPMNDRMAFSSTDAAFNIRQMEVIVLGIAIDTIVKEGMKSKVVPHAVISMVEDIYNRRKAAADEELNKIVELNPLIPAVEKGAKSFSASLLAERDKRITAQKQTDARKAAIKARILKAKEKTRFKQLATARVKGLQTQLIKARAPRRKRSGFRVTIVPPNQQRIKALEAHLGAARAELAKLGGKVSE